MSGFDDFNERMARRALKVIANVEKHVRRAALIADATVVQATPVDTGRARSNWNVSVGGPVFTNNEPTDTSGSAAIAQGGEVIATWRVGGGPIFIANGLPYIERLDTGYSAQAPSGMSAQAVNAARAYLAQEAKVLE